MTLNASINFKNNEKRGIAGLNLRFARKLYTTFIPFQPDNKKQEPRAKTIPFNQYPKYLIAQ